MSVLPVPPKRLAWICACLLAGGVLPINAWAEAPLVVVTSPADEVQSGERLSTWLVRHGVLDSSAFPLGLTWQAASEVPVQRDAQSDLVRVLRVLALPASNATPGARAVAERLASWVAALPVTGRVPLPQADARWLQANPKEDPLLQGGDHVLLVPRPSEVVLLLDDGSVCPRPYLPGALAGTYLADCLGADADQVDLAWVVQPDGQVQRARVADWNARDQQPPGPGAWVWAPRRSVNLPLAVSERLAQFLATQVPANDALLRAGLPQAPAPAVQWQPTSFSLGSQLAQAPRTAGISSNDWGVTGLLQTPSARMMEAGSNRVSLSHVYPYDRINVMLQPFEWLEAGFRYTSVQNALYGPDIAGTQAYKDKSADIKLRLNHESDHMPQLALGFLDVAGTGLFSSEYLVASRRRGDWDASLGLAWGYLGSRGNVRNPFAAVIHGFDVRPSGTVAGGTTGGQLATKAFFHGPAALIGGVEYAPGALPDWRFKVELDGNDYKHDPLTGTRPASLPLNFGVVYRASPNVDLSLGFERGNQVSFSVALLDNLALATTPKLLDPALPPVVPEAPADPVAGRTAEAWRALATALTMHTGWPVQRMAVGGNTLAVTFDPAVGALYARERLERALTVLHAQAPAEVKRFVLSFSQFGLPQTEVVVLRADWVTAHTARLAPSAHRAAAQYTLRPVGGDVGGADAAVFAAPERSFDVSLAPAFHQNIGGPDGFILYAAGAAASLNARLDEHTFATGLLDARVVDNYSLFKYEAPSLLPRVRSKFRRFLTTSRVTLSNLQVNHVQPLDDEHSVQVYGGILEFMYAGVGAEYLYRPWNGHFAFGVDVNRVQQRGFDQRFDLASYKTTTGHATVYWDTGWEHVKASVAFGRYLAGDVGATFTVQRPFDNGASMGLFFTKTNVSAAQYGEGSFDKGIFVSLPFDAILPKSSSNLATFVWDPLVRDGGARLGRTSTLYDLTSARDSDFLKYHSAGRNRWDLGDDADLDALAANGTLHPVTSVFADLGRTGLGVGRQMAAQPLGTWLQAAGLIGGAALLDKPVATLATHAQGSVYRKLGSVATNIPYVLGVTAVMAATGAGDPYLDQLGWTALKSAALTYGTGLATKLAVARQRPIAGQGTYQFNGPFGQGAGNSSFPSDHVSVAFALATPFAQAYGAPGLYAIAGATALGRIEQQQHFLSDTVAGGLLGYMIGSFTLQQQRDTRAGPGVRLSIGSDRSVNAYWELP